MIAYNTRLVCESQAQNDALREILRWNRQAVNEVSAIQFTLKGIGGMALHDMFYHKFRDANPLVPSQVVIKAINDCVACYRAARSNKHTLIVPVVKKALSMRFDKRLYSKDSKDAGVIKLTTSKGRLPFRFVTYPKLQALLDKYEYRDPLVYERNGELWIGFIFENDAPELENPKLALGVDLGIRIAAACSDGRLIVDKKFNAEKRRLRYLKRCLKSKGTKSARKHLKRLRRKERNKNRNQTHAVANCILNTPCDTIVLEDLTSIKASVKASKPFSKSNRMSQTPFYDLRLKLTYKASLLGKRVVTVSPKYTSQIDSLTGKRTGERKGRRYYAKSGLIYDADLNAARNIGQRSKLPVSYGNVLDGQGLVIAPIACKSAARSAVPLQAPRF